MKPARETLVQRFGGMERGDQQQQQQQQQQQRSSSGRTRHVAPAAGGIAADSNGTGVVVERPFPPMAVEDVYAPTNAAAPAMSIAASCDTPITEPVLSEPVLSEPVLSDPAMSTSVICINKTAQEDRAVSEAKQEQQPIVAGPTTSISTTTMTDGTTPPSQAPAHIVPLAPTSGTSADVKPAEMVVPVHAAGDMQCCANL
jgi:hypothetical protein